MTRILKFGLFVFIAIPLTASLFCMRGRVRRLTDRVLDWCCA